MEEKAAGKLTESAERPGSLGDSTEEYVPARWTRKKIALTAAIGVVAAALSIGCAAALYLHTLDLALTGGMDAAQQDDLAEALQPPKPRATAPEATAEEADEPASSAYYVAILGCDARPNETIARSDVTMLARIDTETGIVHLVSVPRDMMVEIEGHGIQKINAALAFGGPAGAVRALSAFAGVPITHYVELRFEQLVELVDRLGGVTVDVPEGFTSDTSGITLAAGTQTLSGEEALAFARERHAVSSGDFSRAAAQRAIISAIADEVLASPPTELPSLVGSLASCVTTDYTAAELALSLAKAKREHRLEAMMKDIERNDLVILDEFGYVPIDVESARLLFQVVSACYERRSMIFTTNIEFSKWGTILGDDKLAAAMIDRIVHHGRLIEFGGPSHRMDAALMLGKANV